MPKTLTEYSISTDKEKLQVEVIHHYLSTESYWAKNIPIELVKKSIENSFCFGVYFKDEQIGFARLITDYAIFAYLADVFILEAHRGQGLSKKLMQFIMAHPKLQNLRVLSLRTKDAHGLYAQFGFKPIQKPENYMEIKHDNFYKPKSK
ncbi:MAG: GNAT family N-acetyltransferase [Bacteroidia bacterium]